MRITALNPPFLPKFSRGQRSPAVTRSGTLYFPIWLSYGVAALEQAGHQVDLIDAPAAGLSMEQVSERIARFAPGLVVVETSTPSIESDVRTADGIAATGVPVLLVGTHPSALPAGTIALGTTFSGVVAGEYEIPLTGAAAAIEQGRPLDGVPGLVLRRDGGAFPTGPSRVIEDLDSLPFVSDVYARHLEIPAYNNPNALHPQVMVMGGRGCPNFCTFCVFPQTLTGRRLRLRSPSSIVAEMLWVEENLPRVKAVFFEDDTISADIPRLRELARAMIDAGVRISWTANMRACVDFETLDLCRRAGLRSVCTGFESGDDAVLSAMRKGVDTATMKRFAADARRAGVIVHGCFLFGSAGETRASMERTLDFALALDPDTAQFYPLMVYPGTEAYDQSRMAGLITAGSWREWLSPEGLHNCVIRTGELSGRDLVEFCDLCRRRFYLRPRYILRKLWRSIRDPDEMRRTMLAFRSFYRYLLPRRRRRSG